MAKDGNNYSVHDLRTVLPATFSDTRRRKRTGTRQRRQNVTNGLLHLQPPRETILDLNFSPLDPDHIGENVRLLLGKELKNSDVGSLGRIVLPKREAEAHLPVLTAKEGISLPMYDMETSQVWTFKYRYWPNNKSRMYILENTGDYVKSHDLQVGDFIVIYKADEGDRFIICAKKKIRASEQVAAATSLVVPSVVPPPIEDGIFDSIVPDIVVARARYSDLFLPWAPDGMNMAFGLNYAFSTDFPSSFPDEMYGSSSSTAAVADAPESSTSAPKLGSIHNLTLDGFP